MPETPITPAVKRVLTTLRDGGTLIETAPTGPAIHPTFTLTDKDGNESRVTRPVMQKMFDGHLLSLPGGTTEPWKYTLSELGRKALQQTGD